MGKAVKDGGRFYLKPPDKIWHSNPASKSLHWKIFFMLLVWAELVLREETADITVMSRRICSWWSLGNFLGDRPELLHASHVPQTSGHLPGWNLSGSFPLYAFALCLAVLRESRYTAKQCGKWTWSPPFVPSPKLLTGALKIKTLPHMFRLLCTQQI